MRLLHTSDLHVGHEIQGQSRLSEHRLVFEFLKSKVLEERVSHLVITGDIYDRHNPSTAATALFYRFLGEVLDDCPKLSVYTLAGNHDSPTRVGLPSELYRDPRLTIVSTTDRDPETGYFDPSALVHDLARIIHEAPSSGSI